MSPSERARLILDRVLAEGSYRTTDPYIRRAVEEAAKERDLKIRVFEKDRVFTFRLKEDQDED